MTDERYREIVRRTLRSNGEPDENDLVERIVTLERAVLSHDKTIAAQCASIDSLLRIIEVFNKQRESAI
jgi:hypothetical protein